MVGFLLGKTALGFALLPHGLSAVIRRRLSQSEAVSQEWLDLESPNFTVTAMPTCPTSRPDMTSLATSGRKLSQKNRRKSALGGITRVV